MSVESIEKGLASIGNWALKLVFVVLGWLAVQTFSDMKESVNELRVDVREIHKDIESFSGTVQRIDERSKNNTEEIKALRRKEN